jgi:hypothetical protein
MSIDKGREKNGGQRKQRIEKERQRRGLIKQ